MTTGPGEPSAAARGTVREWWAEHGWGVIDSAATPGGCWCHFSHLEMDGYRTLVPGGRVAFTFEQAPQDGYAYRAVRVRPAGSAPPRDPPSVSMDGSALSSSLEVRFDESEIVYHAAVDGEGTVVVTGSMGPDEIVMPEGWIDPDGDPPPSAS